MIQFVLETDRALFEDALRFAQHQVRKLIDTHPDFYPMYTPEGDGNTKGRPWTNWCDGFLPGMMWIFHKWNLATARGNGAGDVATNSGWSRPIRYTTPLEPRKHDRDVHDLGLIFLSTYYRWYRLTQRSEAERSDHQTPEEPKSLRFKENGQYLRSFVGENSLFIDLMMNVGIIFYAARETGDRRLRDIAAAALPHHAALSGARRRFHRARGLIRSADTGEFLRQTTQQGYRGDSCWSRGLALGALRLQPFAMNTAAIRAFLKRAEACADYYVTHSNGDGVPPWDFNAPLESRANCWTPRRPRSPHPACCACAASCPTP